VDHRRPKAIVHAGKKLRHVASRHSSPSVREALQRQQQQFACDLHDALGPKLTALHYLAKALAKKLQAREQASDAMRLVQLAAEAAQTARTMAQGLMALPVEDGNLTRSLKRLGNEMEHVYSVPCRITCGDDFILSATAASHLYYIAQEALHNAVKHSGSRQVELHLDGSPEELKLTVRDNGNGRGDGFSGHQGAGMPSMRCRAGLIKGSLDITHNEGDGTVVTCTVPVHGCSP